MRKHRGTPSQPDTFVTLAAISPPSIARGRVVGGEQSGLARCKPSSLFKRGASSCTSQGRHQGEPWGTSPQLTAPTYQPTFVLRGSDCRPQAALDGRSVGVVWEVAAGGVAVGGGYLRLPSDAK